MSSRNAAKSENRTVRLPCEEPCTAKQPTEVVSDRVLLPRSRKVERTTETRGEDLLAEVRGLVGAEGCVHKTFVGCDGTFAPQPHAFQVSFWLYDHDAARLICPGDVATAWTQDEGRLPISNVTWSDDGVAGHVKVFSRWMAEREQMVTFSRVSLRNTTSARKNLSLCVVLRPSPLLKEEERGRCREMVSDGAVVAVDEQLALMLNTEHTEAGETELAGTGVLGLTPGIRLVSGEEGLRAAVVLPFELAGSASRDFDFVAPACAAASDRAWLAALDFDTQLVQVAEAWRNRVPLQLRLPDKRYEECFYSSLHYMLIMMTDNSLWPGPLSYREFFLHDAVDMVDALERVGLHDVAKGALELFEFNKGERYLDGLGGSIYGLWLHFALTGDRDYLREVYPRIARAGRLIQDMRAECLSVEFADSALWGLLPPSDSQDNFGKAAHLYVDNWWAIIGLKSAMLAAKELARTDDLRCFEHEYLGLLDCVQTSLTRVMKEEDLPFMPAFADYWPEEDRAVDGEHRILGDAQMAWAHRPVLTPGLSLGVDVPRERFAESYRQYWERAGQFSNYDGGWFVEYEDFFWGYNVALACPLMYLGMNDVALQNIEWSLNNQACPGGWMEAMKSKTTSEGWKVVAPGVVGDVPHGWVAAHYVLLIRQMLLREEDGCLLLLCCIPDEWFDHGKIIEVRKAPTFFGEVGFVVESRVDEGYIDIDFLGEPPPNGYTVCLPRAERITSLRVDGMPVPVTQGMTATVAPGASRLRICYGG